MKIKKIVYVVLFFLMIIFISFNHISKSKDLSEIKLIIDNFTENYNIPGLAIVITKNKKIIYKGTHGIKKHSEPFKINDISYIASVSKPITATAIMILVEQGLLDINSPITDYINDLKLADGRENEITIKHLLNHTSGLNYLYKIDTNWSLNNLLYQIKNASLTSKPGTKFYYNNLGYNLLGIVIERVSRTPYHQFIENKIFKPLGMSNSTAALDKNVNINGYTSFLGITMQREDPVYKSEIPSGYILSSALDVSKFLRFQINGLGRNHKKILNLGSLKMMHTSSSLVNNYALGWYPYKYKNIKAYRHDGALNNYTSQALYYPDSRVTISILTNKNHLALTFASENLLNKLTAKIHGVKYKENILLKLILMLYPIIILGDILFNLFGIRKVYKKYIIISNIKRSKLYKPLISNILSIVFIASIPFIVGVFLKRKISFSMILGMAPDLMFLIAISALIVFLKIFILNVKLVQLKRRN